MSRNLALFLGAAVAFYLIGAVNGSMGMYALSAGAVAVVLACYSLTRFLIRGVEVELGISEMRTWPGGKVPGRLVLRHLGQVRRSSLGLTLVVKPCPEDDGEDLGPRRTYQHVLPALPPQSRLEFAVNLDWVGRGVHRVQKLELSATDPLAMFRRPRQFDCEAEFLGMPRVYHAEGLAAWDLMTPEARRAARRRQISSGEFRGIRPHAVGDDLRHVHWKVTAHTGELVVKEFEHREGAEAVVWVDLSLGDEWAWPVTEEGLEPDEEEREHGLPRRILDYLGLTGEDYLTRRRPSVAPGEVTLGSLFRELMVALGLYPWDEEEAWEGRLAREARANALEARISLAASLVSLFVRQDLSVSLAGQGLPAALLSPSRGDAYLDHALVALAKAGPSEEGFAALCMERVRRSQRLENVFVLASYADRELVGVVRELVLRGAHVGLFAHEMSAWAASDLRDLGVATVDLGLHPGEAALGAMAEATETVAQEGAGVG